MLIGHSFVKRLAHHLIRNYSATNDYAEALHIDHTYYGVGVYGQTGLIAEDTLNAVGRQVLEVKPHLIALDIAGNDLCTNSPLKVATNVLDLILKLHNHYKVQLIVIIEATHRYMTSCKKTLPQYNRDVDRYNEIMRSLLEPLDFAIHYKTRGLCSLQPMAFPDGIHPMMQKYRQVVATMFKWCFNCLAHGKEFMTAQRRYDHRRRRCQSHSTLPYHRPIDS